MQTHARVDRIEGSMAVVELAGGRSGCGHCNERGGCGSAVLTEAFGTRHRTYRVPNTIEARCGEHVLLELPAASLSRTATAVYVIPALAIIAGAAVGVAAAGDEADWAALAGAAAGFAASLAGIAAYRRRTSSDPKYRPVLSRSAAP